MDYWLSIVFFAAAYVFIIVDKVHRTIVVWVAAAMVLALGVISRNKLWKRWISILYCS